ncbi:LysR family transcriptional regulator [Neptunomonas japonica]|uniref:LysR family transcriptional regulator n=1 Tax=Neptunomonas japonica JAMM 1380 TaxID=1441457 RepID=A0A7R6SU93_9GAMM|nr:LysR family transcriptional regulator [Neptunomonas japonica]BBB28081.1 LysR family transcriptional regulator [Neptunomonas japonica JAMM 1380]
MNWDDLKVFLEVARTEKLSQAAKRLGIDASTVSRRLHRLEDQLATQLFDRSTEGHSLTEHGQLLLQTARDMDQRAQAANDILQGKNLENQGKVRLGVTEAFGNDFIAPELARFCQQNPQIIIDLLPLQRFVKWSHQEVEIAVTIEKPPNTSLVVSKLCDYGLSMYASRDYLENSEAINVPEDIYNHPLIGYVDDLVFSDQLSYLERLLPNSNPCFRSTSVVTQSVAVREGLGLAMLPHFLARRHADLIPVLPQQTSVVRTFWIAVHPEQKKLARVNKVWQHLKRHAQDNAAMLMEGN